MRSGGYSYGPVIHGEASCIPSLEREAHGTIRARCVRLIGGQA